MRGEDASLLHCACAPSRCACAIGCPLLRGAWWDSTRRCGAFIFPHRGVGVIIFGNEACGLHAVRWYGSSSKHAGTCSRLVGLAAYVLDWTPEEVDGEFPVHNIYEIHVERGGGTRTGWGSVPRRARRSRWGIRPVTVLSDRVDAPNVSPTNKFYPTKLARRRAEYAI